MGNRTSRREVRQPHSFFGQVVQRNQFGKQLMVVARQMVRKDDYQQWERTYAVVKDVQKDSLLLPQSYEIQEIKKFFACCQCPADYQLSMSFERFDILYKAQLQKRQKQNTRYKQTQLFQIMYNLSLGLKQFQRNGITIGDIRPSQMIVTSQNHIKMISVASFPWQVTALDKYLNKFQRTIMFYFSPQQIQYIRQSSKRVKLPNPKSQAFSLGVALLQVASLEDSQTLYNQSPRTLNMNQLYQRLNKVKKFYPNFGSYLQLLLKQKAQERLSGGQIWAILRNYSQKILQFQIFEKNEENQKNSLNQYRKNNS